MSTPLAVDQQTFSKFLAFHRCVLREKIHATSSCILGVSVADLVHESASLTIHCPSHPNVHIGWISVDCCWCDVARM